MSKVLLSKANGVDYSLPFLLPLAAVVAMGTACGQRSRTNVEPTATEQKANVPVTKEFSGEWVSDAQVTPDPTQIYASGCANPGEPEHKTAVDTRLKDVESFEVLSKYQDQKLGFLDEEFVETPKEISAEEVRTSRSMFKALRFSDGTKSLSADDKVDVRCSLEAGASELNCLAMLMPQGPSQKGPMEYSLMKTLSCEMKPVSEDSTSSETIHSEFGNFMMARAGKSISGMKRTTVQRGEVFCSDENGAPVSKGLGEKTTVEILSNEIPSRLSARYCGGSQVLKRTSIKIGDDLLSESSFEILGLKAATVATN